jgi:hypothetical protein
MAKRTGDEAHARESPRFAEVGAIDLNRPRAVQVNSPYLTRPSTTLALIPPNPNELLIT